MTAYRTSTDAVAGLAVLAHALALLACGRVDVVVAAGRSGAEPGIAARSVDLADIALLFGRVGIAIAALPKLALEGAGGARVASCRIHQSRIAFLRGTVDHPIAADHAHDVT